MQRARFFDLRLRAHRWGFSVVVVGVALLCSPTKLCHGGAATAPQAALCPGGLGKSRQLQHSTIVRQTDSSSYCNILKQFGRRGQGVGFFPYFLLFLRKNGKTGL